MRQALMQSFEQIYLLDLHGNSLKKERCPDGSKDENVFDIRQGVAIGLFIKKPGLKRKVCHAERWGLREDKNSWLEANDFATTNWTEIHPKSPMCLFVPRDEALLDRHQRYPKLTEMFPVNSVGIVTARDNLTIQWTPEDVWTTVLNFSRLDPELAREAYKLGKDARDWKVRLAQEDLKCDGPDRDKIVPILYRPFDIRYTYYAGRSRGFHCMPRPEVMRHMLWENLGLITPRQFKEEPGAFVAKNITGHKTVSAYDINSLFPLYLYPEATKKDLFRQAGKSADRKPNLDPVLISALKGTYGKDVAPEEIFFYIYAVLYAPTYRTTYADFLKIDFPRVPFTRNQELFTKVADLGRRLVDLHLLKSPELDPPIARFPVKGNNSVEKPQYNSIEYRVYINGDQYFEGVKPEVWQYQIGGYQVLDKWLKDRKGRRLSLDEIRHYCHVVTALAKTISLQAEIDRLYPQLEQVLVHFP